MKANEFVKKHGWDAVIAAVNSTNAEETAAFESTDLEKILAKDGGVIGFNVKVYHIPYCDVKRLVESHEIIESHGGLGVIKRYLGSKHVLSWDALDCEFSLAVSDVESCQ